MNEIVLDGPKKNALGSAMMRHISEGLTAAAGGPVLLTGKGDTFSAGLDLEEVVSLDVDGMRTFLNGLQAVVGQLFSHPGPTVVAVNGHAIAGGCILAAVCDHRVATSHPGARIGLNEVALGLRFPPAMIGMLQARVPGLHRVILSAALSSGAEARLVGLVDEVADDALAVARAQLQVRAAFPPAAYAANKADLLRTVKPDPDNDRRFLEDVLPVWTSDALRSQIKAFLSRSKR